MYRYMLGWNFRQEKIKRNSFLNFLHSFKLVIAILVNWHIFQGYFDKNEEQRAVLVKITVVKFHENRSKVKVEIEKG